MTDFLKTWSGRNQAHLRIRARSGRAYEMFIEAPGACNGPRNLGTSLGTKPCQTPLETVMHDARKCKKSQLLSVSGFNNGLEVRVLPGSPLISKHLAHSVLSRRFVHCGDSHGSRPRQSLESVWARFCVGLKRGDLLHSRRAPAQEICSAWSSALKGKYCAFPICAHCDFELLLCLLCGPVCVQKLEVLFHVVLP
jgi:hypothetical protein